MAKTIFWDWNGTLCDDLQVSLDAVNDLLYLRNRDPITLAQYYSYVDTPISKFYEHLFELEKEITMQEISVHYQSYYNAHLPDNCLMDGAREVLELLRQKGVKQVILSSTHADSIIPRAEKLGIMPYFDAVLASDNWYALSKVERAKKYCEENMIAGTDAWFVGDSAHDADAADVCGGTCILIPKGHQSEAQLREANAVFCKDIRLIPQILGE